MPVEKVHGFHHSIHQYRPHRFRAALYGLGKHSFLVRVRRLEHICLHRFPMARTANTDLQASEILVSQVFDNGGNAPVATGASFHCQSDTPYGKIKVIMDYDHLRGRDLEIPQHLAHSLAAAVHVGERFEENHLPSGNGGGTPSASKFALFQVHGKGPSQQFEDLKTRVVSGGKVILSRISQSHNSNYLVHRFPLPACPGPLTCSCQAGLSLLPRRPEPLSREAESGSSPTGVHNHRS